MRLLAAVSVLILLAVVAEAKTYTVTAKRVNSQKPLFCNAGDSIFHYNYNPAWVPAQGSTPAGLLVRCQNRTASGGTTPSNLAFAPLLTPVSQVDNIKFGPITPASIVMAPHDAHDDFGDEDPRIVYNPATKLYYLHYTEAQSFPNGTVYARLCVATSATPTIATSWIRHGEIFPQVLYSKSGAAMVRNGTAAEPHLLFWGDSSLVKGLQLATSLDLITYQYLARIWLPMRPTFWDSGLVEGGPLPHRLSDGNYLMLYNSARHGFPSPDPHYDFQYNIGWVILDGTDPEKILQRSDVPLLSPELIWEKAGLTANVVFVEGWTRLGTDTFLIFYGAADTCIGAAVVTVTTV